MYELYQITNLVNQKKYVGISKNAKLRFQQHTSFRVPRYALQHAIKKYGPGCFHLDILCIGSRKYIQDLEELTITAFGTRKSGYNVAKGGIGGDLGSEANLKRRKTILGRTPEEKQAISKKLSESLTGTRRTPDQRFKMSSLQQERGGYGPKSHTAESRQKMSATHIGKKKSNQTRTKMSDSAKKNQNHKRFDVRITCLCCQKEWNIGNYTQHTKKEKTCEL